MKKSLIVLFLIFVIISATFASVANIAFAEETQYIMIPKISADTATEDKTVYLYQLDISTETFKKTLALPYSYFVQIKPTTINYGDDYVMVIYNGITGFISKKEFGEYTTKSSISNPFYQLNGSYKPDRDLNLKSLPNESAASSMAITRDTTIKYIGYIANDTAQSINDSQIWFYVSATVGETTSEGYIHSSWCNIPTSGYLDIPLQELSVVTPQIDNDNSTSIVPKDDDIDTSNNLFNVLLSLCIAVPTLLLMISIFKPVKPVETMPQQFINPNDMYDGPPNDYNGYVMPNPYYNNHNNKQKKNKRK